MRAYTWTAVAATAFLGSLATTGSALAISGANTASLNGTVTDTQGSGALKTKSIVVALTGPNTASLRGTVKNDVPANGAFKVKSITVKVK
jgi:hypothetical protein